MEQFADMTNEELTRLILCSLQDGHMVSPTYTAAVAELKRRQSIEKSDSISDFFSQLEDIKKSISTNIEKGGEGSKGGKIIGHTKSGKPIYASHLNYHDSHKNYTKQDHLDSKNHHLSLSNKLHKEAEELEESGKEEESQQKSKESAKHSSLMEYHRSESFKF